MSIISEVENVRWRIEQYQKRMAALSSDWDGRSPSLSSTLQTLCKGLLLCLEIADKKKEAYLGECLIDQYFGRSCSWAFGGKAPLRTAVRQFSVNMMELPCAERTLTWLLLAEEMIDDTEKAVDLIFHTPATLVFFQSLRQLMALLRLWTSVVVGSELSVFRIWAEIVGERCCELQMEIEDFEEEMQSLWDRRDPTAVREFVRRFQAENNRFCERMTPLRVFDRGDLISACAKDDVETILSISSVELYYADKCNRMESVRAGILRHDLMRYDYVMSSMLNPDHSMIGGSVQVMVERLAHMRQGSHEAKIALASAKASMVRFFSTVDETFPLPLGNSTWNDVMECVDNLFFFAENVADGEADTDAEPMKAQLATYHDRMVAYSSAVAKVAGKVVRRRSQTVDPALVERLEAIYRQGVQIQAGVDKLDGGVKSVLQSIPHLPTADEIQGADAEKIAELCNGADPYLNADNAIVFLKGLVQIVLADKSLTWKNRPIKCPKNAFDYIWAGTVKSKHGDLIALFKKITRHHKWNTYQTVNQKLKNVGSRTQTEKGLKHEAKKRRTKRLVNRDLSVAVLADPDRITGNSR